jgi:hypothetical protein
VNERDDDDEGTRAMLDLRRSRGQRMLAAAATIGGLAAWWIKHGLDEQGDALLIWAPGGIALVIAGSIAVAGLVMLVTRPRPTDDWR